jgi:two-component system nitrogen regulation response regulator GlnG
MVSSPPLEWNPSATAKLNELMEAYFTDYFQAFGDQLPPAGLYDRMLREVETPLITAALTATHGNQIKAAKLLGINRNTIRRKIREQKIKPVRSH